MRVTVTDGERELIATALSFSNLKKILSTEQVESLFGRVPLVGLPDPQDNQRKVFLSVNRERDPKKEKKGIAAYQADQVAVRERLAKIVSGNIVKREEVARDVERILARTVPFWFRITRNGLRVTYGLSGVEACCAYALALILDQGRGLVDRLGRCDAPQCGRFNLAFEGRPRRYCNEKHRRSADAEKVAERVRRWRQKKQKDG